MCYDHLSNTITLTDFKVDFKESLFELANVIKTHSCCVTKNQFLKLVHLIVQQFSQICRKILIPQQFVALLLLAIWYGFSLDYGFIQKVCKAAKKKVETIFQALK